MACLSVIFSRIKSTVRLRTSPSERPWPSNPGTSSVRRSKPSLIACLRFCSVHVAASAFGIFRCKAPRKRGGGEEVGRETEGRGGWRGYEARPHRDSQEHRSTGRNSNRLFNSFHLLAYRMQCGSASSLLPSVVAFPLPRLAAQRPRLQRHLKGRLRRHSATTT